VNRISITKGKRTKKNSKRKLTVGIIIFIIIIIVMLIILKFTIYKQDNIVTEPEDISNQVNEIPIEVIVEESKKQDEIVSVEDWPKTMTAKTKVVYYVIGKIVIEKIGVEKYILDRTTDNSLDMAVTNFVEEREINEVREFLYNRT
jgi:sortase (surface protein transpeptidase)